MISDYFRRVIVQKNQLYALIILTISASVYSCEEKRNYETAIIAGGMLENQEVTDKVFLINFNALLSNKNQVFTKFQISPNPTSDFFVIEKEGNFGIEIWDAIGRFIFSENKNGKERIDISKLNPGVYFVKIYESDEWVGMEKLIVK